ncbi:hypothetical protein HW532_20865 [Kaustia mangrovi]|uniref:Uncharacterized protein n=1 Tax=Kaustia mangrovi TaxID=2593653 RepID=A0A7S8C7T2_9HYPH|nr:hypothetical protein [Kaustia mangrovi]QPC44932.1 hypothetical protein HW532_20865 [Kaustia mangrovi]
MAFEQGLNLFKHGASFIAGQQEAEAKRAWQKYNNAMVRLADAQNQNAITTNRNLAIERSTEQGFQIERSEYVTKAAAEVAAAAIQTEGRSVNQTLFQIESNAAHAQARRKADLEAQFAAFDHQRMTSAFQAAQQIDYSIIPEPSPVSSLLGFGAEAFDIYSNYTT